MKRAAQTPAYERPRGLRSAAGLVVLVLHGVLFLAWASLRSPPAPHKPTLVTLQVVPLAPETPPLPPPLPPPQLATAKPTAASPRPRAPAPPLPRADEVPALPAAPAPRPQSVPAVAAPAPPAFQHAEGNDEWVQPAAPVAVPGAGARRAPSDYAEAVKSRVISQVVYPENARYPPPKGFKGDPRELMRECMVPYEVVVDRQGAIVSYQIERCGDPLLDAAAEDAVRKAQPFPPPPPGAEQYRVYGNVNFIKPRLGPAK